MHNGRVSEEFKLNTGVKPSYTLSPMLFNILLDNMFSKALQNVRGIQSTLSSRLTELAYVDDICISTQSFTDIENLSNASNHLKAKTKAK